MITPPVGESRHPLHSGVRTWPESNCYLDLWIGLLHALGLDPVPMLLCGFGSRFEVDQWTFCKPAASELALLYGVRVEELNIWGNLREHVERQVAADRIVLLETDGYFLPDTGATTYRQSHGKTTIAIHRIEASSGIVHYLHNSGAYALDADDARGVFGSGVTAAVLPPFAEFVDVSRVKIRDYETTRRFAATLALRRLGGGPSRNPFLVWSEYADRQLADLAAGDLAHFHAWAFGTVRQAGAVADLLSHWCRWIDKQDGCERAASGFAAIAGAMAAQQFRLARLPGGGRPHDFAAALSRCAPMWDVAHAELQHELPKLADIRSRRPTLSADLGVVVSAERS